MREVTAGLLLASLVLFASAPARADMVGVEVAQADTDHNGTADVFLAEIWVDVPDATQVRAQIDGNWVPFENDGGGEFWLEPAESNTLAGLLANISGPMTLEITTPGNVSTYDFTISGNETAIAAMFPTPIPEITGLTWDGNTATLSWSWGGNPNDVDLIGVEVGTIDGNNWTEIYWKSNDQFPPDYLPKTALEANDIVFPAAPGTYDEIEFLIAYVNVADVSGGSGTIVTGWTLTGGNELFGDPNDRIIEEAFSEDALIVPEPATLALLSLGVIGMIGRRGRRAGR